MFARLAPPRRFLRYDRGGEHRYSGTISWTKALASLPRQPFAVPLAGTVNGQDRHWLLCFDLDAHVFDAEAVEEDLINLLELLYEAEVEPLVVKSGPGGGYHVWVAIGGKQGTPSAQVKRLAKAMAGMFRTLDWKMLCNVRAGCVRPPGAPHRAGGVAEIDTFYAHRRGVKAALDAFVDGAVADAVERIWKALPAEARKTAEPGKPANRPTALGDDGYDRMKRPWRQLSPTIAALAERELEPDEDASARLHSLTLGCAFAGWTFTEYQRLCETAPAAVYARSARDSKRRGVRIERRAEQRRALLERQWNQGLEDARKLPMTAVGDEDDAAMWDQRVQDVVAGVMALSAQMRAEPHRWAGSRGPCDEKVLRGLLVRALEAVTLEVGASTRSIAEQVGVCGSTGGLALNRLQEDSLLDGPAWIKLETEAAGPNSRVYKLLVDRVSPEQAPAEDEADTDPEQAEEVADRDNEPDTGADQAEYPGVDITRSQGTPAGEGERAQRAPIAALEVPLKLSRHDIWHPQRGLGHHTGRTYTAIMTLKDPHTRLTYPALAALTGYSERTVAWHVERLARVRLAVPGQLRDGTPTVRATARSLDAAAKEIGATGILAARVRRHALEREVFHWWSAEQAWRTSSHEDKAKTLGVPADLIREYALPLEAAADLRWKYGRFPTTAAGRADWGAARRIVAEA